MAFGIRGTTTAQLIGGEEFLSALDDLESGALPAAGTALEAIGEEIVGEMQADCPVDTGALQASIGVTEVAEDHVTIEATESYAGFVNYGTIYQEPQPFWSNVVENLESFGIIEILADEIIQVWNDAVSNNQPNI